jgi:hypothetical protein
MDDVGWAVVVTTCMDECETVNPAAKNLEEGHASKAKRGATVAFIPLV